MEQDYSILEGDEAIEYVKNQIKEYKADIEADAPWSGISARQVDMWTDELRRLEPNG